MARFGRSYTRLVIHPVLLGQTTSTSPADAEGLTDSLTLVQTQANTFTEAEGLTDSASTVMTQRNTFPDSEGLTDSLTLVQTIPITLGPDSEGLTDSAVITLTQPISFADSEGLTDSATNKMTQPLSFADPEGLTDSASTTMSQPVSFTESEGLTDSVIFGTVATESKADTEGLTDSVTWAIGNSSADTEGLTDSLSTSMTEAQNPSDTEGLTDSVSTTMNQKNSLPEAMGLTDSLALGQTTFISFSDAMGLTDSMTQVLGQVAPSDPEGLTDSLTFVQTFRPTFADPMGLSDFLFIPGIPGVEKGNSLVLGPGSIFLADYGAVEPTTAGTPDPLVWTDLGSTLGGVDLTIDEEYKVIELKQMPDTQVRRLDKRYLSVKTELAEATLQNLVYALNEPTASVVSGAGYTSYSPSLTVSPATALTYRAVLVRGWAPVSQKKRTLIIRKGLSVDNVEINYKKDDQTTYTVTWSCHYAGGSTAPFLIIDEA